MLYPSHAHFAHAHAAATHCPPQHNLLSRRSFFTMNPLMRLPTSSIFLDTYDVTSAIVIGDSHTVARSIVDTGNFQEQLESRHDRGMSMKSTAN
jgi:hypothetical protein